MLSRLLFNTKFYFIKIFFIDKYIFKLINNNDSGVIKIKNSYFLDIPKVGASSIKYLLQKSLKDLIF